MDELSFTTNVPQFTGSDVFAIVSSLGDIVAARDGAKFFGGRDVNNSNTTANGGNGEGVLIFDAGNICTLVNPQFAWYYNARGLDNGDDLIYQLVLDGVPQERITYLEGKSGAGDGDGTNTDGFEEIIIDVPATAALVELRLIIDQNGGDDVAIDNVRVLATGTDGSCTPICGVRTSENNLSLLCTENTAADGVDAVSAAIKYRGQEVGATVSVTNGAGVAAESDDPGAVSDGTIRLEGLAEGGTYTFSITGSDCVEEREISFDFTILNDFCLPPSPLVINEILADPGNDNDSNGDGEFDGAGDEFVELYNSGSDAIDVSGYTVAEGSGVFFSFPAGTTIEPANFFTIFGGGVIDKPDCTNAMVSNDRSFIGLNNAGDVIIVRDTEGRRVAGMSYGSEGGDGQSLALSPDGNLEGGYQRHGSIRKNPVTNSACASNGEATLPVTLLAFDARASQKAVTLSWSTADERGHAYFEVERSGSDGDWTVLGSINAGAEAANEYVFHDRRPNGGINYYRLRQVDFDGTPTIHGPVGVNFGGTVGITAYPNPTEGALYLNRAVGRDDIVTITSVAGRPLRRIPSGVTEIGVADLPSGMYLLSFERAGEREVIRFVKR